MNRTNRYCLVFLTLTLIGLSFLSVPGEVAAERNKAEEAFHSRVPREVGKFTKDLLENSISVEISNEVEWYQPGKGKQWYKNVGLTKKRGQFYVMKSEKKEADCEIDIHEITNGINSHYCFELKKNKAGNAWLISNVVFVTPDFDERKQGFTIAVAGGGFRRLVDNFLSALTSIELDAGPSEGISVEKLLEMPGFQLATAELDAANQNVLRINFSYEATDPETKKSYHPDSVLEFDLSMHCLPIKLRQSYKVGSKEVIYDWQRIWGKKGDRSYTIERTKETKNISGNSTTRSITKDFLKVDTHDLPESDFTLSAFGFPEPPGVEWNKPFPWYLVVASVGTVCLGVFFFLRARGRRLRACLKRAIP